MPSPPHPRRRKYGASVRRFPHNCLTFIASYVYEDKNPIDIALFIIFSFVPIFMELIEITSAILQAFQKKNQKKLRKINDDLLHQLVVNFTPPFFELAVLSYVLSKIISKTRFLHKSNEKKLKAIEGVLQDLSRARTEEDILKKCKSVLDTINLVEKEDARYIVDLVSKGRLKVGATAYAQGVSLGTASEMTGMDKQEIMDYAGKTMMFDRVKDEKTIEERLIAIRKLMKKGY